MPVLLHKKCKHVNFYFSLIATILFTPLDQEKCNEVNIGFVAKAYTEKYNYLAEPLKGSVDST